MVPEDAKSLLFTVFSPESGPEQPLTVSLNGQNVPVACVSVGSFFITYGSDVSAFAGKLEDLSFTSPQSNDLALNLVEIDDINFSPVLIPEPGSFALFSIGALLFCGQMNRF